METQNHSGSTGSVAVIGAGYIGYPLSLLLASTGHVVLAVDVDEQVVAEINNGTPRFDEPGIGELAKDPAVRQHLRAATTPETADVFIIAVPTPLEEHGHYADLSLVEAATRSILPHLRPGNLVIVESTIPPGTTGGLVASVLSDSGMDVGTDILLAHCPERLHPGSSLHELRSNDRIIGGINEASTAAARAVYATYVDAELLETDATTAELCKLLENTYRDVNIALTNQMAAVAEGLGVDPLEALRLASLHPRVDYLQPGIGVGGHCIPIDPWFLHQVAPRTTSMITTAREVNRDRELLVADRIADELGDDGGVVVLAGVAYKANVSDSRESPALSIARMLRQRGIEVRIYDPLVDDYSGSLMRKIDGADLVAILVRHSTLVDRIASEWDAIEAAMRHPRIIDFSTGSARQFGV